jgi:hypothetical protein
MRNDKLVAELGTEPHTPIDEAVWASLIAQGSLSEPNGATTTAPLSHVGKAG